MKKTIDRRHFLKTSTIAIAGLSFPLIAKGYNLLNYSDSINLGIIGTGDRGAWESYILSKTPGIEVIACCDIIPKHLQDGLKYAVKGATAYKDYEKLLSNKNIDAVLIATPQHLHYQMVLDALEVGKDIICEKTMTLNTQDALQLSRTVKSSNSVFQVGYQWQSSPLFNKIKAMIANGDLGKITHVRCNYNRNGDWRVPARDQKMEKQLNWRMYREFSGGLTAELCSHHINVVNWFLNDLPNRITGVGGIDYWKDGRETYDNVNLIFEYGEGIKAIFQATTTNAFENVKMVFMGTEGTILIEKEEGQIAHFYSEKKRVSQIIEEEKINNVDAISSATQKAWVKGEPIQITVRNNTIDDLETTRAMFLDFVEAVHNRKEPISNIDNGRNVSIAVDLAIKAMDTGNAQLWKPEYSSN